VSLPREELVSAISERAAALRARIEAVTDRDVTVVAVTKGHPVEVAAAAAAAGFVDLGENYAQELVAKQAGLDPGPEARAPVRWHFIGHLQSNKVRSLAGLVWCWQSIDRASVADAVARRAAGARVMVQVDLAGAAGRAGCAPGEVEDLVGRCRSGGLEVVGLMAVGPLGPPEAARDGFRFVASTARRLGLPEVSMGMSGDLEVALSEGATMVRVGSALVGPRPV